MHIKAPDQALSGEIEIPGSKSISNRSLIIRSLCADPRPIHGLSDAKDTRVLHDLLEEKPKIWQAGEGGTTFRFLLARLALEADTNELHAKGAMQHRPIGPLLDALMELGAEINCIRDAGRPPIRINGKGIRSKRIKIDAGQSSQFVSALMMIAANLDNGLQIDFEHEPVSFPYLSMTAALMRASGAKLQLDKQGVLVQPKAYETHPIEVEADWSSAAFVLAHAAHLGAKDMLIKRLRFSGLQGDERIAELFTNVGLSFTETTKGVLVNGRASKTLPAQLDLLDTPDLMPVICAYAALRNEPIRLTGLQSLVQKESNRILAMSESLSRFGAQIEHSTDHFEILGFGSRSLSAVPCLSSYQDHRITMAMSLLSHGVDELCVLDPEVVDKSFPNYWKLLSSLGFVLNQT